MSAMALGATAQEVNDGIRTVNPESVRAVQKARMAAPGAESRWLNYGSRIQYIEYEEDTPPSNEFVARAVYTAPDSLMLYGENNSVWRHAVGEVIDPANEDWDYLNSTDNNFTVDSIAVDFIYERFASDGAAADTLEIVLVKNMLNSSLSPITWPGNSQSFLPYTKNDDLTKYGGITPSYVNEVIKVALTDADTSVSTATGTSINSVVRGFSSPHSYSAGDLVGASVRFIPGYSYNSGDTLFNHNNLGIISIKENSSATIGAEYSDSLNYNKSMILDRFARYQLYPQAFLNQTFLVDDRPALPQHHSIYFKVSSPNVTVDEFNAIGVTMYPNPTTGIVNIKTDAEQSNVQIFNMLGQEVISSVETGNFNVDLTSHKAGIYFVTIKNDKGTATSKIVKK